MLGAILALTVMLIIFSGVGIGLLVAQHVARSHVDRLEQESHQQMEIGVKKLGEAFLLYNDFIAEITESQTVRIIESVEESRKSPIHVWVAPNEGCEICGAEDAVCMCSKDGRSIWLCAGCYGEGEEIN